MSAQSLSAPHPTRRKVLGFAVAGATATALSQMPGASATAAGHRSRRTLIRRGDVITMDPANGYLPKGDVMIEDGKVTAVGENLPRRGAHVIEAAGMTVLPGFVDPHTHLCETLVRGLSADSGPQGHRDRVLDPLPEKFTPEAVYYGTLAGALCALRNGTTTLVNWDLMSRTREHALAAVQALADAGIRAKHSVSASYRDQSIPDGPPDPDDIREIAELIANRHPLLGMHMGTRNANNRGDGGLERVMRDYALAEELEGLYGQPVTVSAHAGLPSSVDTPALLEANGLLGPRVTLVNGSAFTSTEFELLARHRTWVVTAPEVEQASGNPPPLGLLLAAGLLPAVCTDTPAYTDSYMPTQLRMLLRYARAQRIETANGLLTMADAMQWGTNNPAASLGMSNTIGSITVGKEADIVLLKPDLNMLATTDPYANVVTMSNPGTVHTVLVAGRVVVHRGELVGHDLARLRRKVQLHQAQLLG